MYYKMICILYVLLSGQNFIVVKSGCYNTRERTHIGTKWSRVTCLSLPLVAPQSLGSQALEDSQIRRP
jgi:hypothetical protein